jgi:dihydrofolate reductase
MFFNLIFACDNHYGIGKNNTILPWKLTKEMEHFKTQTLHNIVVMGRKTADTFKSVLKNRINIVMTSQKDYRKNEGFISFDNINDIHNYCTQFIDKQIYVIGGSQIIETFIDHPRTTNLIISHIDSDYHCDVSISEKVQNIINQDYIVQENKTKTYNEKCHIKNKYVKCSI